MPPQTVEERVSYLEGQLTGLGKTVQRIEERVDHLAITMNQRFNELESRINGLEQKFESRINGIETRINGIETRINGIEQKFESRINGLEQKFESRINGIETRINGLEQKLDSHFKWSMGLLFTSWITILIAIFLG